MQQASSRPVKPLRQGQEKGGPFIFRLKRHHVCYGPKVGCPTFQLPPLSRSTFPVAPSVATIPRQIRHQSLSSRSPTASTDISPVSTITPATLLGSPTDSVSLHGNQDDLDRSSQSIHSASVRQHQRPLSSHTTGPLVIFRPPTTGKRGLYSTSRITPLYDDPQKRKYKLFFSVFYLRTVLSRADREGSLVVETGETRRCSSAFGKRARAEPG